MPIKNDNPAWMNRSAILRIEDLPYDLVAQISLIQKFLRGDNGGCPFRKVPDREVEKADLEDIDFEEPVWLNETSSGNGLIFYVDELEYNLICALGQFEKFIGGENGGIAFDRAYPDGGEWDEEE